MYLVFHTLAVAVTNCGWIKFLSSSQCLSVCLLQDADDGRRSRRSRKDVNYAELNDVYLPPLGPQDLVGNETAPSMPSTRSRARRNDVYIQEDYLAPRVRSTSSRRRWRDLEEEDTSQEEESVQLQEENRTISHSPIGRCDCEGGLEMITEEDENLSRSTTPDSAQNKPSPGGWNTVEVVKKKPRFACLDNVGDENDDLSPANALVHQSVTPPLPPYQFNVPSGFHAPLPPPKHNHHTPLPQAPPVQVQASPILPTPPFQAPSTYRKYHTPLASPLSLSGSLPLHLFGGALASKPYSITSGMGPGNHCMKLPTNLSLPETLLRDEESMNAEDRTLAQPTVAAPPPSIVNRSTENKNLLSDQQL